MSGHDDPTADAMRREVVRRVLVRLGERRGAAIGDRPVTTGPASPPGWMDRLPPELRGTYGGRWDEPFDEGIGVFSPTEGPDAGRCAGCGTPGACAWVCAATTSRLVVEGADRVGATIGARSASRTLAARIDHTLLKPDASRSQIDTLCEEAARYGFASVCINGYWVPRAVERLRGTGVPVCAVVGFPLGANLPEIKAREAALAVEDGAAEIDMVMQIGWLIARENRQVAEDIQAVVNAARVPVKVILETALLTRDEKIRACALAQAAGAAFVKTSTGFGPSGATIEDVRLMRETVGPDVAVKAAGGIRDADAAQAMIEAGADRIGASASVRIAREAAGGS